MTYYTIAELIDLCPTDYMKRELSLLKDQLEDIRDDLLVADDLITAADESPEAQAFNRAYNGIRDILEGVD